MSLGGLRWAFALGLPHDRPRQARFLNDQDRAANGKCLSDKTDNVLNHAFQVSETRQQLADQVQVLEPVMYPFQFNDVRITAFDVCSGPL
jgi:hypothetical protein